MNEYELSGIETIARGVAVIDGEILLCRAKGGKSAYLPGGHIEFGETARDALVREIREEMGLAATAGRFMGAVENTFLQNGKPHAEINLVFELRFARKPEAKVKEAWIEFEWCPLGELEKANLLPAAFTALGADPQTFFAP